MAKQRSRPSIIAGNWKMYKTAGEAVQFIDALNPLIQSSDKVRVLLAPPFTAIYPAAERAKGTSIVIGAQNMNDASEGAFTGEVAALMLKEAGAQFVILGHSERRRIFKEDNGMVNRKVLRALEAGLQPIVCIGETREEHEANKMEQVLKAQLVESLAGVTARPAAQLVIAYEPVWAIGTGLTATPEQAQKAHAYIRKCIEEQWSATAAQAVPIIYGGSVKPDHAKALMEQPDIDGLLVGGAALQPDSFARIVNFEQSIVTSKG
jgi:triosephosphate isomerase